jgi:hypothetical protein
MFKQAAYFKTKVQRECITKVLLIKWFYAMSASLCVVKEPKTRLPWSESEHVGMAGSHP